MAPFNSSVSVDSVPHPERVPWPSSDYPRLSPRLPGTQAQGPGKSEVWSGFDTFIVKLGNNYTGLSLTAQQTNRKRTEPEGVGAVPAHARGGGGGRSEKEKDRKTEIITNQRDCARSARDGGGVRAGREPFPEERGGGKWHEPRETRPQCGHLRCPKPPSPNPTPQHTRETRPPPHSDNPRRHSLPSPRADTPAREPHG